MSEMTGHYVITCPDCEGRMFIDRKICPTCAGDGRLLIPENHVVFRFNAKQALAITICAALFILGGIALYMVNQ